MREIIQDKITTDTQSISKEKDKSKALFLEVTRLGAS